MKNFIPLLGLAFVLTSAVKAQHLVFSPLIEKTVAGNQYGAQLSFENKKQWSVGVFYQKSLQRSEGAQSYYPFYGATLNAPLIKSEKINFYFNVRAGFVNDYFFVIAPGFETRLTISKLISVSMLTSVRMESPSASLRIDVRI